MNTASEALFSTDIIDASRYRRLKPVRYTLYFILLVFTPIAIIFTPNVVLYIQSFDIYTNIQNVVFWLWVAIVVITLWLYYYSRMSIFLGEVSINTERIKIDQGDEDTIYQLNEVSDLEFIRGATFHYGYQKERMRHFYYVQTVNNWISFTTKEGKPIKFEFMINSHVQNIYFEDLIKELRRRGYSFDYRTI